ncbi:hypothetical protein [Clostridium ljungdahlii]|uniref:hypothetical protein n=1 Tax=Clostridium ljungdahlii TaxID=1538 RepID=UPI0007BEB16F|nr:hypothetical protein [Clostridium ljungdahlii]
MEKINVELISEAKFSLEDFVKGVTEDFNKEGFLLEGTFKKGYSEGTFKSNLWVVEDDNTIINVYIDFRDLYSLKFKNLQEHDLLIVKCWLAECFLEGYGPKQIQRYYN